MFDKLKGAMGNLQAMQALMRDENFRTFLSHPKVQALFEDPEFRQIVQTKDFSKIMTHPKFANLTRDPEVASLMAKAALLREESRGVHLREDFPAQEQSWQKHIVFQRGRAPEFLCD